jgi:hypothetical protein
MTLNEYCQVHTRARGRNRDAMMKLVIIYLRVEKETLTLPSSIKRTNLFRMKLKGKDKSSTIESNCNYYYYK